MNCSGHASVAFLAMCLLALFLTGKLRVLRGKRSFPKLCVCLAPLSVAWWVAISRTLDNRHHFSDVVAGCLIGSAFSLIYFFHYRSLSASDCDECIEGGRSADAPTTNTSDDEVSVLIESSDDEAPPLSRAVSDEKRNAE